MAKKSLSTEFLLLADASENIQHEFIRKKSQWAGSRFEWVTKLSSGSKGKMGKRLINAWCALNGLAIEMSPDSQADILINGHRIEIKFSMLWEAGIYKFQQIRDQNYEYMICLGISPSEAHVWVVSKLALRSEVIGKKGQHTGKGGKDTAWFSVNPNKPPKWLSRSGGSLSDAIQILKKLKRKKAISS